MFELGLRFLFQLFHIMTRSESIQAPNTTQTDSKKLHFNHPPAQRRFLTFSRNISFNNTLLPTYFDNNKTPNLNINLYNLFCFPMIQKRPHTSILTRCILPGQQTLLRHQSPHLLFYNLFGTIIEALWSLNFLTRSIIRFGLSTPIILKLIYNSIFFLFYGHVTNWSVLSWLYF